MNEWNQLVTVATLAYSSADASVFVASTSADLTGSISVGMRLRLSQVTGGIKYFIVVAISSSAVTIYGGTDYSLTNETISDPVFSTAKVPYGFPADPAKWTVSLSDTSDRNQSNPVNSTWYNLGSLSLDIPIGSWYVSYQVELYANKSSAAILDSSVTLSNSSSSESDSSFTGKYTVQDLTTNTLLATKQFMLFETSNTTYYLLARSSQSSISLLGFEAATYGVPTKITAICAYL